MTKLWFKARNYGRGWTPASTEGWIVFAVFLVLIIAGTAVFAYQVRASADTRLAGVLFALWIVVLVGGLTAIGFATGEPPRWRWGA